jgi:formylglycine-generating enzyme required for sulfatase activity
MKRYLSIVFILITACVPVQEEITNEGSQGEITDKSGVEMVFVPAGEFTMGSDAKCETYKDDCSIDTFSGENPPHMVSLADFYIDKYEVTNAHYKDCVAEGACNEPTEFSSATRDSYYEDSQYENYPVVFVDWNMAKLYCEWRGARLPTEAEWEKAARGENALIYPWGNDFDGSLTNFCDKNCEYPFANMDYDDGYQDTSPMGTYPGGVSPYGAHDMAGNVFEWVNSAWAPYPYNDKDGREDLALAMRVFRGGSLGEPYYHLRTSARNFAPQATSFYFIGFRCARDEP